VLTQPQPLPERAQINNNFFFLSSDTPAALDGGFLDYLFF